MATGTPNRQITPRKWALAGTVAASTLMAAHPVIVSTMAIAGAVAGTAAHASEGGEAGEAGVVLSEGPSAFLTKLGYFEGTYRIIAALYLNGGRDLAREHMDESHHAFYEDIEPTLAENHAAGFKAEDAAFTKAIADDVSNEIIEERLKTLLGALQTTAAAADAPLRQQILSIKDLMALATAEYDGGVDDGKVELAIEYRDSWGFYQTARARAETISNMDDPKHAQAGRDVLERLKGLDALYPSLISKTASDDLSQLAAAAAWIEIIALRQD